MAYDKWVGDASRHMLRGFVGGWGSLEGKWSAQGKWSALRMARGLLHDLAGVGG